MTQEEIIPPWIKFPEYPPGDPFWRQSGEIWFHDVWLKHWNSLTAQQQEEYLKHWSVPQVWRNHYFDSNFQNWLNTLDD